MSRPLSTQAELAGQPMDGEPRARVLVAGASGFTGALAARLLWRHPRLELAAGTSIRVRVPARDVALSLSRPADVSTVNRLPGTVTALEILDATHVDVRVRIGGRFPLLARVTREATERLGLTVGLPVWCLIKSVALDRATLMMAQKRPVTLSCGLATAPAAANDAQA